MRNCSPPCLSIFSGLTGSKQWKRPSLGGVSYRSCCVTTASIRFYYQKLAAKNSQSWILPADMRENCGDHVIIRHHPSTPMCKFHRCSVWTSSMKQLLFLLDTEKMVQLWISRPSMAHVMMILQAFCIGEAVVINTFFQKISDPYLPTVDIKWRFSKWISPTKNCVDFTSSSYLF